MKRGRFAFDRIYRSKGEKMGIVDKFIKSRRIKAFVEKATVCFSSADCRIKISDIAGMCDALIRGLVELRVGQARLTLNEFVDFPKFKAEATCAFETKLLGVCPECHIVTNGEQLVQMYRLVEEMRKKVDMAKSLSSIGVEPSSFIAKELLSSDVELSFLKGKCRNSNCDCEEILIFWRPHEDKKATNRLAKMGIKI